MNYFFTILLMVFSNNCIDNTEKNDAMVDTGKFIMMPENEMASFIMDFNKKEIEIRQGLKKTIISLQPITDYEDYYAAPKGRKPLKNETKIIHISKNVFNKDDGIEILVQVGFSGSKKEGYAPFVVDFLLHENGPAKLFGSTYEGTGQGSNPVFALIDDKAYYGIYDDRRSGDFLYPHQKLNAAPHIMDTGFTNGYIVFKKINWEYAKQQGIPIDRAIKERKNFITKIIGDKKETNIVNHTIQYYNSDYSLANTSNIKIEMVATYGEPYYNLQGVKSLMNDLAQCKSIEIIKLLMFYLSDGRSIDLPGDDYGNTTISYLAENQISAIFFSNPEFLINYGEKYITKELLEQWWENNKLLYD